MFCENCGHERSGDGAFCEFCGKPFVTAENPEEMIEGTEAQEKIIEGEEAQVSAMSESSDKVERSELASKQAKTDIPAQISSNENTATSSEKMGSIDKNGSELQWMYEFSFWRNPAILITVAKVLLISLFVPAIFMFVITLGDGFGAAFGLASKIFGYGILLMAGLLAVAYLLIGLVYGGKYFVLFKMDDAGVSHIQLDKQYKKAQALGFLTALIGLSSGKLNVGGAGILAATKQSLYTSFKKVKSVKAVRSRNTIYVNESMTRNQIYAVNEDFDFVLEHILSHCPKNVRVSGR